VPYETILAVLESLFYRNAETTWSGRRHELVARLTVYVARIWRGKSSKGGGVIFGSEENAAAVSEVLKMVLEDVPVGMGRAGAQGGTGLTRDEMEDCRAMREEIERILR
jgi:hypothetical protein